MGRRAGSFCTYELIRRLKKVTREEDTVIANEVKKGVTTNIPSVVRASFSIYNKPQDIAKFVQAIAEISSHTPDFYVSKYMRDTNGSWHHP